MTLPTDRVYALAWNSDGTKLAVGNYASSLFAIYDFDISTGALSNRIVPGTVPGGTITHMSWRHDDSAIACGVLSTPYIVLYTASGDTYTKISNPESLPTAAVRATSWNSDGTILLAGALQTGGLLWYDFNGTTLVARTAPAVPPTGNVYGACWIDDAHVAAGHTGTTGVAYLATYTVTGGLLVLDAAPVPLDAFTDRVTTVIKHR